MICFQLKIKNLSQSKKIDIWKIFTSFQTLQE